MIDRFIHRTLGIPYTLHVYEQRRVKKAKTTLVFLHGVGASGAAWDEVLKQLAHEQVNILVVDLLGFGASPKPTWAQYSATMQSKALAKTLLSKVVVGNVVLVGHSMGALIAIEFAKRYERFVRSLVLCSPPLYDDKTRKYLPDRDRQLKAVYQFALRYPDQLIQMSIMAKKYGLVGQAFTITPDTVDDYSSALKAAIINQTSLKDIAQLSLPIEIIYGSIDPFVIGGHLKKLAKENQNVHVASFIGGHEIEGRYVALVTNTIKKRVRTIAT